MNRRLTRTDSSSIVAKRPKARRITDIHNEYWIGIDVAKDSHYVTALDYKGTTVFKGRFLNTPEDINKLIAKAQSLKGQRTIGTDMEGGMATLINIMLIDSGERVFHVPGRFVNRARAGIRGGDNKSDPIDSEVIADRLRTRLKDLRLISINDDVSAAIRVLARRRRSLTTLQTRQLAQLHEMLGEVNPGLEAKIELNGRIGSVFLLTQYVTPTEIRKTGREAIKAFLKACPQRLLRTEKLVDAAIASANEQLIRLPGEDTTALIVKDMARDVLETRTKIINTDSAIEEQLKIHPKAALILTMPGMGVILTAEFIAHAGSIDRYASPHHLAAAAGLAPVLRQTGKTSFISRPLGGNKSLKRVFYQSAFITIKKEGSSKTYYDRKRAEGKSHQQALIALAKKRVIVLFAMLRDDKPYSPPIKIDSSQQQLTEHSLKIAA